MLIDGRPIVGEGPCVDILNPATGQMIDTVASASVPQIDQAVVTAERAFEQWRLTTPARRSGLLLELAQEIETHADRLASIESMNTGKPLHRVREDEIPAIVDCFRFFAGAIRCVPAAAAGEYVDGRTSMIRRDPIGVVAQIAPWNYPLMMAAWKLAPALAAGNCVLFKPSELTPLSILALVETLGRVFPPGTVAILPGAGSSVGHALAAHPKIRLVSFTGSVASGRAIQRAASDNLKRVHLELGGNAPVLVFEDTDIALLGATLRSASFYNAGQDCTAACRIYAQRGIYDQVAELLARIASSIQVGDPGAVDTEMGPLISHAHRDRVSQYVERACALPQARCLWGGGMPEGEGCFYPPTVIADLPPDAEIVKQEIFGPVVTLTVFDEERQAIEYANASEYGLGGSIWTGDCNRAIRLIPQLNSGVTWVNEHFTYTAEMPHGGFKQSGNGIDLSAFGLHDYLQTRHVMLRH